MKNKTLLVLIGLVLMTACTSLKSGLKGVTGINTLSLEETLELSKERPAVYETDVYYKANKVATLRKIGILDLGLKVIGDDATESRDKRIAYYRTLKANNFIPSGIVSCNKDGTPEQQMERNGIGSYAWETYDKDGKVIYTLVQEIFTFSCKIDDKGRSVSDQMEKFYFAIDLKAKKATRVTLPPGTGITTDFEEVYGKQFLATGIPNKLKPIPSSTTEK